ncbi:MAG: hypothetical protein HC822_28060, partial [Oscillochloris sp.]|nr:hypothetical protein [Oscillochloris sp.]
MNPEIQAHIAKLQQEIAELEHVIPQLAHAPETQQALQNEIATRQQTLTVLTKAASGIGMVVTNPTSTGDLNIAQFQTIITRDPTVRQRVGSLQLLLRRIADERRPSEAEPTIRPTTSAEELPLDAIRLKIAHGLCTWHDTADAVVKSIQNLFSQLAIAAGLCRIVTASHLPLRSRQALAQLSSDALAQQVFIERRRQTANRVLRQGSYEDALVLKLQNVFAAPVYNRGIADLLDDLCDENRGLAALALAFAEA